MVSSKKHLISPILETCESHLRMGHLVSLPYREALSWRCLTFLSWCLPVLWDSCIDPGVLWLSLLSFVHLCMVSAQVGMSAWVRGVLLPPLPPPHLFPPLLARMVCVTWSCVALLQFHMELVSTPASNPGWNSALDALGKFETPLGNKLGMRFHCHFVQTVLCRIVWEIGKVVTKEDSSIQGLPRST